MTTAVDMPADGSPGDGASADGGLGGGAAAGWRATARLALAHLAGVAWAGAVAGLAVGVLGRLLMRLAFLLRPHTAGQRTEAGEVIGQLTADGTAAFVFFSGIVLGLLGAAAYLGAEPWLRRIGGPGGVRRWAAITAFAVALLGPFAYADELDFLILRPPAVHVVLFGLLPVVGGTLVWALLRRRERRPAPVRVGPLRTGGRLIGALIIVPILLAHPMAVFADEFARPATAAAPFHVAAVVATLVHWQRRAVGATPPVWLTRLGVGCTAAVIVLGLGQFLRVAVDQL